MLAGTSAIGVEVADVEAAAEYVDVVFHPEAVLGI
jgi:hypothetical protein